MACSLALFDQVAFGVLLPVLPIVLLDSSSAFYLLRTDAPHLAAALIGTVFAVFPLSQLTFAPVFGGLSDRYGRRPLLLISVALVCASYLCVIVSIRQKSVPLLLFSRVIAGAGAGAVGILFAVIADISAQEGRARGFGIVAAASGVGLVLGPFLGAVLSDTTLHSAFNLMTPLYVLLGLGLIIFMLVVVMCPETRPSGRPAAARPAALFELRAALKSDARTLYIVSFMFAASLFLFIVDGPAVMFQRFHAPQSDLGYLLSYFGLVVIGAQLAIPLLRRVARDDVILRNALFGLGGGLLVFYFAPSRAWLSFVTPWLAACVAFSYTMIVALLSVRTPEDRQGEVLSVNVSVQALAQVLMGATAALLASAQSPDSTQLLAAFIASGAGVYLLWEGRAGTRRPMPPARHAPLTTSSR